MRRFAGRFESRALSIRWRGANFNTPLYTKRAAVDRTPRPPANRSVSKEQP